MNYSDPPSAGDGDPSSRATTMLLACHQRHGLSLLLIRGLAAEIGRVAVRAFTREFDTTCSSDTQGAKRHRDAANEVPGTG